MARPLKGPFKTLIKPTPKCNNMTKKEIQPCRFCFFVMIVFFSLATGKACAQEEPKRYSVTAVHAVDSLVAMNTFKTKKRFWRASGELMLVQVVPWAYNYYVRDADFAKISWESIGHNLQFSSWEWDDNSFKTNQFAHPYHGNLYFSSFRTNGYNFWQSAPAAFAGSYMWEVAGETHPPAPNDFINTSLGGISLGEITFRLSNHIVNNRQRGFKRQMQEVFGFLVSPLNGFNRILDGRWGRVHYAASDTTKSKISGLLDIGSRRFSTKIKDVVTKGDNEFYVRLKLQYGNADEVVRIPFSSFNIAIEAGAADSAYMNQVMVNGVLKQWVMGEDENHKHLASVTMNYDYFLNNSFEYGGQSFNFKFLSEWNKKSRTRVTTNVGAGFIALAAVPDDYLYYGEGRNYDYGPGIGYNGGVGLNFNNRFLCSIDFRGGWFRTLNGNKASFYLNSFSTEFRYMTRGKFSAALGLGHLSLIGNYKDYEDVNKSYPYGKVSIGYRFSEGF